MGGKNDTNIYITYCTDFFLVILNTLAVSPIHLGSILIFASCIIHRPLVFTDVFILFNTCESYGCYRVNIYNKMLSIIVRTSCGDVLLVAFTYRAPRVIDLIARLLLLLSPSQSAFRFNLLDQLDEGAVTSY